MTIFQLKATKTAERTHLEKTTILLITSVDDASACMDFSKKYWQPAVTKQNRNAKISL